MEFSEEFIDFKKFLFDVDIDHFKNIDFQALEQNTGLHFGDTDKDQVVNLLKEYVKDEFVWGAVSAKKKKQLLRKVIKSCETLESMLSFGGFRFYSGKPDLDEVVEYTVWYQTSPRIINILNDECRRCAHQRIPTDGHVVEYLAELRRCAERMLSVKDKPGRTKKIAIRQFLSSLHELYLSVGGRNRGGWSAADGTNRGPFWELATGLLSHTTVFFEGEKLPFEESNLLEYIKEVCPSKTDD